MDICLGLGARCDLQVSGHEVPSQRAQSGARVGEGMRGPRSACPSQACGARSACPSQTFGSQGNSTSTAVNKCVPWVPRATAHPQP